MKKRSEWTMDRLLEIAKNEEKAKFEASKVKM